MSVVWVSSSSSSSTASFIAHAPRVLPFAHFALYTRLREAAEGAGVLTCRWCRGARAGGASGAGRAGGEVGGGGAAGEGGGVLAGRGCGAGGAGGARGAGGAGGARG